MPTPDAQDDRRTAQMLWNLSEEPVRAARHVLTVRRIALAAIDIADADGIDAVSMQRVAVQLGVTKMALYRYVTSKNELIAVMTETAVGPPPHLDASQGWRDKLTDWAEKLRQTWQQHPWIPQATVGDRIMGPQEIGWTEAGLATLDGTGLAGRERMDAVYLLSGHIRNCHSVAGTQPWSRDGSLNPHVSELVQVDSTRFPALMAASLDSGARTDNGWQFGLERVLDGIELLIERRK